MSGFFAFIRSAALIAGVSIGAGMFALPYVFGEAGWFAGFLYLAVLAAFVTAAHSVYWDVLDATGERRRLTGLVRKCFGRGVSRFASFAILGGLTLVLVIYLILAEQFVGLAFPGFARAGMLVFWLLGSAPLLMGLRRLAVSEMIGGALMIAIILLVYLSAPQEGSLFAAAPLVRPSELFLPFGAVLFSFAAWTGVEPAFDLMKKRGHAPRMGKIAMAAGTYATAALYFLFVMSIFSFGVPIAPDALTSISLWGGWQFPALVVLGLFALWTSYVPVGLEIVNALHKDLKWPRRASLATVMFTPPLLLVFGLRDFLAVVGLAGGIFLSVQYGLILLVGKKLLVLSAPRRFFLHALIAVFLLAAAYEVYYFIAG